MNRRRKAAILDSDSDDDVVEPVTKQSNLSDDAAETENSPPRLARADIYQLGDPDEDSDDDITIRRPATSRIGDVVTEARVSPAKVQSKSTGAPPANIPAEPQPRHDESDQESVYGDDAIEREAAARMRAETEDLFDDDDDDQPPVDIAEGAEQLLNQDQQNDTTVVVKKQRKLAKRRVLNAKTLIDPAKGLLELNKSMLKVKFKGKGSEAHDLNQMMWYMEHWAHRLYPRAKFDDVIEQIEKLGKKAEVKSFLKKLRIGEFDQEIDASLGQPLRTRDDEIPPDFDEMMSEDAHPPQTPSGHRTHVSNISHDSSVVGFHTSMLVTSTPFPGGRPGPMGMSPMLHNITNTPPLTDDARKKMEENRRIAMAKRAERLAKANAASNSESSPNNAEAPEDTPPAVSHNTEPSSNSTPKSASMSPESLKAKMEANRKLALAKRAERLRKAEEAARQNSEPNEEREGTNDQESLVDTNGATGSDPASITETNGKTDEPEQTPVPESEDVSEMDTGENERQPHRECLTNPKSLDSDIPPETENSRKQSETDERSALQDKKNTPAVAGFELEITW